MTSVALFDLHMSVQLCQAKKMHAKSLWKETKPKFVENSSSGME